MKNKIDLLIKLVGLSFILLVFSCKKDSENTNPSLDKWSATSTTDSPDGRLYHTAIWTGSEMIVWGGHGESGKPMNTGGRYNPSTDTWSATSTSGAPDESEKHLAVWTGNKMIVWGGTYTSSQVVYKNTGGIYDPSADSWQITSTTGAPHGRKGATAVWDNVNDKMIIWGGHYWSGSAFVFPPGKIYDPNTDTWSDISTTDAPQKRQYHTAIWTGTKMIVWGGTSTGGYGDLPLNDGGIYDPGTDTWTAISTDNAADARFQHTAVWTGTKMIVWGGFFDDGSSMNSGGIYDLSTDTWSGVSTSGAPSKRIRHGAVWTGNKMIVWGGRESYTPQYQYKNDGGVYDPSTDTWQATSMTNVPLPRDRHTAVWTGSQMIVWGGYNGVGGSTEYNTGGLYTP
jgi:N-acetylneuraminic acid mutarotase